MSRSESIIVDLFVDMILRMITRLIRLYASTINYGRLEFATTRRKSLSVEGCDMPVAAYLDRTIYKLYTIIHIHSKIQIYS